MAKTLQDIIDGKAQLTEKEKESLKKAMGISSGDVGARSTDPNIAEKELKIAQQYQKVLR